MDLHLQAGQRRQQRTLFRREATINSFERRPNVPSVHKRFYDDSRHEKRIKIPFIAVTGDQFVRSEAAEEQVSSTNRNPPFFLNRRSTSRNISRHAQGNNATDDSSEHFMQDNLRCLRDPQMEQDVGLSWLRFVTHPHNSQVQRLLLVSALLLSSGPFIFEDGKQEARLLNRNVELQFSAEGTNNIMMLPIYCSVNCYGGFNILRVFFLEISPPLSPRRRVPACQHDLACDMRPGLFLFVCHEIGLVVLFDCLHVFCVTTWYKYLVQQIDGIRVKSKQYTVRQYSVQHSNPKGVTQGRRRIR